MKTRDIFIVSQEGLNPEVNVVAVEAIQELLTYFPHYKKDYPITDLGPWKSAEYTYVEDDGRTCYIPYASTQWHIEKARQKAQEEGHNHQLKVDTLFETIKTDPTNIKYPQFTILLTKDDLYAETAPGFCLGMGDKGIGCVMSAYRFLNNSGNFDGLLGRENFKTVLMHEFGHVIGLTYDGRKNSVDNLGAHCACSRCIMQQRPDGNFTDVTLARLEENSPICDDCIEAGEEFFAQERTQRTVNKIVDGQLKKYGLRR